MKQAGDFDYAVGGFHVYEEVSCALAATSDVKGACVGMQIGSRPRSGVVGIGGNFVKRLADKLNVLVSLFLTES
jgi:hypothetical protein